MARPRAVVFGGPKKGLEDLVSSAADLTIAVVCGGPSTEAEVSRKSAQEVTAGLKDSGFSVQQMELNQALNRELESFAPDVVFPVLHGPPGEDGTVQGFFEVLGLPYVGADVRGSATAMDKSLAKAVFRRYSLPVLDEVVVAPPLDAESGYQQALAQLGEQVVVKPLAEGSALGVTLNANGGSYQAALESALARGGAIVEPFVLGREMTVGVLDLHNKTPQVLPVIEIRTQAGEWYDYKNRYTAGKSEHVIPAGVGPSVQQEMQRIALLAHQALGLRDLSRADFIVTDRDEIVLLEVNTLPGMTPTSLFPDGARAVGIEFPDLVTALVISAHERG